MGQLALARSARAHALRALALTWAALALVVAATLLVPHGWFAALIPDRGWWIVPAAAVIALALIAALPLGRLGSEIVADLRAHVPAEGRLRNVADELAIALGEPAGRVVVHEASVPNVGAFPTGDGIVVMATTQAVEQLRRDELEALVAAQFAGMRDRWCRLATRVELAWRATIVLGCASILFAAPLAMFLAAAMVFMPRSVEVARDLCADVAAVNATRHPAALAGALRHLVPAADDSDDQKIAKRWYLPISPFLVLPKRLQSTTTVSIGGRPSRTYTHDEELAAELLLRAERAEALADGADPREYTGREYRRRWSRLGAEVATGD